jgi:hypothetical protein
MGYFFPRTSHASCNSSFKIGEFITLEFFLRYPKEMLLGRSLKVLLDGNQT